MSNRATSNRVIDSFRGEYFFLSNFYPVTIYLDSTSYPTLEHAYQASKTMNLVERLKIRNASSPGEAKRLGRTVHKRSYWEDVKLDIMRKLLRQKFRFDAELCRKLLETGDAELIEGNNWGDRYWGMCRGQGENHLGKLLMEIRRQAKS